MGNRRLVESIGKKYRLTGAGLIAIGITLLLELYMKTGWLTFIIPPGVGVGLIYYGVTYRKVAYYTWGSLVCSLGIGIFFTGDYLYQISLAQKFGALLISFGLGWLAIFIISIIISGHYTWWVWVPGLVILSAGLCLVRNQLDLVDIILFLSIGLGMAFGIWGIGAKLIGFIIPACLVLGAGIGIYLGWSSLVENNGLTSSGILVLGFGLGWIMIALLARLVLQLFIWWPYIPGGVLVMVGIGLYAGGNPGSALHLIGNASSVGFIIFGIYLLLLRRGIQK